MIARHFAERDEVERRLIGNPAWPPGIDRLEIGHGTINSPQVFEWISRKGPNLVVLYGSGLIRLPLLDEYEGRMVNLHLGLSPYYRGSGTNFWPLVNGEPECVGATIHLVVKAVDAGAILAQVRPEARPTDRAHELGTKTILAAGELLPRVLTAFVANRVQPLPQDLSLGRVYRGRDFNADAVRSLWRRFDDGMMAGYLADFETRRRRVPIREITETCP